MTCLPPGGFTDSQTARRTSRTGLRQKRRECAVNALPDARARLNYIAELTGKAADKVLGAVEASQKLNEDMSARATELDRQWDQVVQP